MLRLACREKKALGRSGPNSQVAGVTQSTSSPSHGSLFRGTRTFGISGPARGTATAAAVGLPAARLARKAAMVGSVVGFPGSPVIRFWVSWNTKASRQRVSLGAPAQGSGEGKRS